MWLVKCAFIISGAWLAHDVYRMRLYLSEVEYREKAVALCEDDPGWIPQDPIRGHHWTQCQDGPRHWVWTKHWGKVLNKCFGMNFIDLLIFSSYRCVHLMIDRKKPVMGQRSRAFSRKWCCFVKSYNECLGEGRFSYLKDFHLGNISSEDYSLLGNIFLLINYTCNGRHGK